MGRTRDYADVIRHKLSSDPDLAEAVEIELFNADVATKVYEARTAAGLTQIELADLVGTQQSVISRIEDADYSGRSLTLLRRIAVALDKKLRVEFCSPISCENVSVSTSAPIVWEGSLVLRRSPSSKPDIIFQENEEVAV